MSYRTNVLFIAARQLGRSLGVNRFIAELLGSSRYEDRFQAAMLSAIERGDNIWDVGANVGLYTEMFSEKTGEKGRVYAFEPSRENKEALLKNVDHCANVEIVPIALGASEGQVAFEQGDDQLGATSRVVAGTQAEGPGALLVDMKAADNCIAEGMVLQPNFVKIDTEGFELDVLQGMAVCLSNVALRVICVEVHFGLLSERGMRDAPAQIELLLTEAGFRCDWSDASHIVATRNW